MVLEKTILKKAAPAVAAVVLSLAVLGVSAAVTNDRAQAAPTDESAQYFLRIADTDDKIEIPGESKDAKHAGEIDITTFAWSKDDLPGVELPVSAPTGGGGGAGKAKVNQIHFNQSVSKASPSLMKAVAQGKHFPQATLTVRKKDKQQVEYIIIKMSDVVVSSYRLSGDQQGIPHDEFSLSFEDLQFKYKPQSASGANEYVIGELDLGR